MENQQFLNELFEHLNSTILSFEKTLAELKSEVSAFQKKSFRFYCLADLKSVMINPDDDEEKIISHLNSDITCLNISIRAKNCLELLGYEKIGHMLDNGEIELWRARNVGEKTMHEIKEELKKLGLKFPKKRLIPNRKPNTFLDINYDHNSSWR